MLVDSGGSTALLNSLELPNGCLEADAFDLGLGPPPPHASRSHGDANLEELLCVFG